MRKTFILLAVFLFAIVQNVNAITIVDGDASPSIIRHRIISTTLDDSPKTITSAGVYVGNYEKVGFHVITDETDTGNDTYALFSVDVSYDNSNWVTAVGTYPCATDDTVVDYWITNEGAGVDTNYCAFLPDNMRVPYVRATVDGQGTASGGNDQIVVNVYLTGTK